MNVTINIDNLENLFNFNSRRKENEFCIYALLIGTIEGLNTYHITDCVYKFIYFNEKHLQDNEELKVIFFYTIFFILVFSKLR